MQPDHTVDLVNRTPPALYFEDLSSIPQET